MFETATFLSVWYWLFMAFFWSLVSNWTFGVSKWSLDGAKHSVDEKAFAAMTGRRHVAITVGFLKHPPLLIWAIHAFFIGVVATMAVLRANEVAQGLLFIIVPVTGLELWRLREARRLEAADLDDDALLKRITEIRIYKQGLGFVSLGAAVGFGMWRHYGEIGWHMID